MKFTNEQICKLKEFVLNLKCPDCYSAKVQLCEEEKDENAECEACGCQFEFKPDLLKRWE